MALQSGALAVLVVGAALVLPVLVAWRWTKASGGGPVRAVGRALAVLAAQLVAVLGLSLVVNNQFDFFTTWSDLTGNGGAGDIKPLGAGSGNAGSPALGTSAAAAPADPVSLPATALHGLAPDTLTLPRGDGRVLIGDLPGPTSHVVARSVRVWLPPQYDEPAYRNHRFPVAVVMAGYPGHPRPWLTKVHLPEQAVPLTRDGRLQPFIAVVLTPTLTPPRDTECTDVPGGPQVETFLARDLPADLHRMLRTTVADGHWVAMGDSTGGYCAVKLALRHPHVYGTAVSLAGYFTAIHDGTTGDLWGGSPALRHANDPLWLLANSHPSPAIHLVATGSHGDPESVPQLHLLQRVVHAPTHLDALVSAGGGHNFETWAAQLPSVLALLGGAFGP